MVRECILQGRAAARATKSHERVQPRSGTSESACTTRRLRGSGTHPRETTLVSLPQRVQKRQHARGGGAESTRGSVPSTGHLGQCGVDGWTFLTHGSPADALCNSDKRKWSRMVQMHNRAGA